MYSFIHFQMYGICHVIELKKALQDDVKLLEAAGRANISVAVIHPSFEPIAEEARNKRLSNAKKNLKILNQVAKENGIVLALENLPRTCLGNTSEEMLSLLNETGAAFIFDHQHSRQRIMSAFYKI